MATGQPKPDDAISTVTSLFTKRRSDLRAFPCATLKSAPIGVYGDEAYYSSSKLLGKYIQDYDKEQTLGLAKSLTEHRKNKSVVKKGMPSGTRRFAKPSGKENEVNKEIKLAKRLLPQNYSNAVSEEMQSLTTDDLLVSNPYEGILNEVDLVDSYNMKKSRSSETARRGSRKTNNIPQACVNGTHPYQQATPDKGTTSSMHYSDIGTQYSTVDGSCETRGSFNLYSLNGVSYTPHKVKYKPIFNGSLLENDHSILHHKGGKMYGSGVDMYASMAEGRDAAGQGGKMPTGMHTYACHKATEHQCISPSPTNLIAGGDMSDIPASKRRSKYAGHTPYRRRIVSDTDLNMTNETDVTLAGDRSWEAPLAYRLSSSNSDCGSPGRESLPFHLQAKSPDIHRFMKDCLEAGEPRVGGQGTVETLKNMLFTLQSLSPSTSREDLSTSYSTHMSKGVSDGSGGDGHRSLKLAMSHLSNLEGLFTAEDAAS